MSHYLDEGIRGVGRCDVCGHKCKGTMLLSKSGKYRVLCDRCWGTKGATVLLQKRSDSTAEILDRAGRLLWQRQQQELHQDAERLYARSTPWQRARLELACIKADLQSVKQEIAGVKRELEGDG